MIGRAVSFTIVGVEGVRIRVEVAILSGLPAFTIVGLPDTAVSESRERIRAAFASAHIPFPVGKVTVNLSPADIPKSGTGLDMPIAVGILRAMKGGEGNTGIGFIGELGLDGGIRPVRGVLPAAVAAHRLGLEGLIVAQGNRREAELSGIKVRAVRNLQELADIHYVHNPFDEPFLCEAEPGQIASLSPHSSADAYTRELKVAESSASSSERSSAQLTSRSSTQASVQSSSRDVSPDASDTFSPDTEQINPTSCNLAVSSHAQTNETPDMSDIRGQGMARRIVEISAAGGHHLLMVGSPGVGKSMLASRIPGILPPLTREEAVETASIQSILGTFDGTLSMQPPFSAPHHTSSPTSLVGGGSIPRPGAITQAHNGVLFLDELPEFPGRALQALREPLETGMVRIHRAKAHYTYPALFHMVAAGNPCPCGKFLDNQRQCECSVRQRQNYWGKVGGPFMDRCDLRIILRRPTLRELEDRHIPESSASIRERIVEARERQTRRYKEFAWNVNARIPPGWLHKNIRLTEGVEEQLTSLITRGVISMRGADKILRLAWSLADLDGADSPQTLHFSEALTLRSQKVM
ncbi:YifB family Mg chelatase-like AAA ATPase [Actinotignum urinale]|nr:YifB family Mg chelatase-like AAA ATPase [Actinotignum urinale]